MMTSNTKQKDWFGVVTLNGDVSVNTLISEGWNTNNAKLKDYNFYISHEKIINHPYFKDANGNFDERKFQKAYNNAVDKYNELVRTTQNSIQEQHFVGEFDTTVPQDVPRVKLNPITASSSVLLGITSDSLSGATVENISVRELAQRNKIRDDKGNITDKTPNDIGFFGTFNKNYALATYDQDYTEVTDDGRTIAHKAGEYKLDSDGNPYYEDIGNKTPVGKQLLASWDVLTVDGSTANKFDPFDSDGLDKSWMASTIQAGLKILPFLIFKKKGLKNTFTSFYLINDTAEQIGTLVSNNNTDFLNKNILGTVKKTNFQTSDYAKDNFFSVENLFNLVSDVYVQFEQQRFIFDQAGKFLSKSKDLLGLDNASLRRNREIFEKYNPEYQAKFGTSLDKAIVKGKLDPSFANNLELKYLVDTQNRLRAVSNQAAKWSKNYMVFTQAGSVASSLKEAGYSDTTAWVGGALSGIGFHYIFKSALGDIAIRGLGMDDISKYMKQGVMDKAAEISKYASSLGTASAAVQKKGFSKLLQNVTNGVKNMLNTATPLATAGGEAIEEMSEEVVQEVATFGGVAIQKGLAAITNNEALGKDFSRYTDEFSLSDFAMRILQAGIGGAIGGVVFALNNRDSWKDLLKFRQLQGKELVEMFDWGIRTGRGDEMRTFLKNQRGKTGLSTTLSLEVNNQVGDQVFFKPTEDYDKSHEGVVLNTFNAYIDAMEQIIANEDSPIKRNAEGLFSMLNKDKLMSAISQSNVGYKIFNDVNIKFSNYINSLIALNANTDDKATERLEREYNYNKELLTTLTQQQSAVEDYKHQVAFTINPYISNSFATTSVVDYARKYGINYYSLDNEDKEKLDADYELYLKNNKDNNDLNYLRYKLFRDAATEYITNQRTLSSDLESIQNAYNIILDFKNISQEEEFALLQKYRTVEETDNYILEKTGNINSTDSIKIEAIRNYILSKPNKIDGLTAREALEEYLLKKASTSPLFRMEGEVSLGLSNLFRHKTVDEINDLLIRLNSSDLTTIPQDFYNELNEYNSAIINTIKKSFSNINYNLESFLDGNLDSAFAILGENTVVRLSYDDNGETIVETVHKGKDYQRFASMLENSDIDAILDEASLFSENSLPEETLIELAHIPELQQSYSLTTPVSIRGYAALTALLEKQTDGGIFIKFFDNIVKSMLGEDYSSIFSRFDNLYKSLSTTSEWIGDNTGVIEKLMEIIPLVKSILISFSNSYNNFNSLFGDKSISISDQELAASLTALDNIYTNVLFIKALNDSVKSDKLASSIQAMQLYSNHFLNCLSGRYNHPNNPLKSIEFFDYELAEENPTDAIGYLQQLQRVKDYYYQKFNTLSQEERNQLIVDILDNVDMRGTFNTEINHLLKPENINSYTTAIFTISSLIYDSNKSLSSFLNNFNPEHIFFYNQYLNTEIATAFVLRPEYRKLITDYVFAEKERLFKGDKRIQLVEKMDNLISCLGDAGTGKTSVVANSIKNNILNENPDAVIVASAVNQERATNLKEVLGVSEGQNIKDLVLNLLNEEGKKRFNNLLNEIEKRKSVYYTQLDASGQPLSYNYDLSLPMKDVDGNVLLNDVTTINTDYLGNEFKAQNISIPDYVIVDEMQAIPSYYLQVLNNLGIQIIGIGDIKQLATTLFQGIDDSSAISAISLRLPNMTNIIRADNSLVLDTIQKISGIFNYINELTKETNDIVNSTNVGISKLKDIVKFNFYEREDEGNYTLVGIKGINEFSEDVVIKLLNSLKPEDTIFYIYDTKSKYKNKFTELSQQYPQLKLKSVEESLGNEATYAIVDVSPDKINQSNTLRILNTVLTRAKRGTLVINEYGMFSENNFENQSVYYNVNISDATHKTSDNIINSLKGILTDSSTDTTETVPSQNEVKIPITLSENKPVQIENKNFIYPALGLLTGLSNGVPNQSNSDLGGFPQAIKQDNINKLVQQLAYLKNFIIEKYLFKNPIVRYIEHSSYEYTFNNLFNNVENTLDRGKFLIKLKRFSPEEDGFIGRHKKDFVSPEYISYIVYQVQDKQGNPYDFTIAALSAETTKSIGVPKSNIEYFDFDFDSSNSKFTSFITMNSGEYEFNSEAPMTLSEFKKKHPELNFSDVYITKYTQSQNNGIVKQSYAPTVFFTTNLNVAPDNIIYLAHNQRSENDKHAVGWFRLDRKGFTFEDIISFFKGLPKDAKTKKLLGQNIGVKLIIELLNYRASLAETEQAEFTDALKISQTVSGESIKYDWKLFSSRFLDLSLTSDNLTILLDFFKEESEDRESLLKFINDDNLLPILMNYEGVSEALETLNKFTANKDNLTDLNVNSEHLKEIITTLRSYSGNVDKNVIDAAEILGVFIDTVNKAFYIKGKEDLVKFYPIAKLLVTNGVLINVNNDNSLLKAVIDLYETSPIIKDALNSIIGTDKSLFFSQGIQRYGFDKVISKTLGIYKETSPETDYTLKVDTQLPLLAIDSISNIRPIVTTPSPIVEKVPQGDQQFFNSDIKLFIQPNGAATIKTDIQGRVIPPTNNLIIPPQDYDSFINTTVSRILPQEKGLIVYNNKEYDLGTATYPRLIFPYKDGIYEIKYKVEGKQIQTNIIKIQDIDATTDTNEAKPSLDIKAVLHSQKLYLYANIQYLDEYGQPC